jgi:hypothetical protein
MTPQKGPASATYATEGKATARVMRLDLGRFGEVHVRFHARRTKMVPPPRGCTGPKAKEKIGIWRGKIRFKGEHRYTTARATEARGKVFFPVDLNCHGGKLHAVTSLSAYKGTTTDFAATRLKGSSKTTFTALDFGPVEAVTITRSVELTAPASTFTFNDALTRAHVKPPWPFSGTGDFASPSSWTGPLMVRFPGKRVALTGAGWTASLSEFNP